MHILYLDLVALQTLVHHISLSLQSLNLFVASHIGRMRFLLNHRVPLLLLSTQPLLSLQLQKSFCLSSLLLFNKMNYRTMLLLFG